MTICSFSNLVEQWALHTLLVLMQNGINPREGNLVKLHVLLTCNPAISLLAIHPKVILAKGQRPTFIALFNKSKGTEIIYKWIKTNPSCPCSTFAPFFSSFFPFLLCLYPHSSPASPNLEKLQGLQKSSTISRRELSPWSQTRGMKNQNNLQMFQLQVLPQ